MVSRSPLVLLLALLVSLPAGAACVNPQLGEVAFVGGGKASRLAVANASPDQYPDVFAVGTNIDLYFGGTSLQNPSQRLIGSSLSFSDIVAGDFDSDTAYKDFIVADRTNSRLQVMAGGVGGYTGAFVSLGYAPTALAKGDFNGDNNLDVAVLGSEQGTVIIYNGSSNAALTQSTVITLAAGSATALSAADIDNDGKLDLAVGHTGGVIELFFGNGDSTFGSAVPITAANFPTRIVAADLDGNNLLDIVSANWDDSMTVNLQTSARTFGAAQATSTRTATATDPVNPSDMVVADFNGDGDLDVVITNVNGWYLSIFMGRGDGTFDEMMVMNAAWYDPYSNPLPYSLAVADFNGDGLQDVAIGHLSPLGVSFATNHCGQSNVALTTSTPTINVSQSATFVTGVTGYVTSLKGTGSVTLKEGATILGSGTLNNGTVSISVSGLSAGDHSIVAHYGGDENLDPKTSSPFVLHVTTATTTTVLSTTPTSPVYGETFTLNGAVTSSTGDTPAGTLTVTIDGGAPDTRSLPYSAPGGGLDVGSHTVNASYPGDETHPPNVAMLTVNVGKATPAVTLYSAPVARYGSPAEVKIQVEQPYSGANLPSGMVSILDGRTVVGSADMSTADPSHVVTITVSGLTTGTHYLHAVYNGDSRFTTAQSSAFTLDVVPADAAIGLIARGNATTIRLAYDSPCNTCQYRVYVAFPGQNFTHIGFGSGGAYEFTNALQGSVYRFRVDAYSSDTFVAGSNIDTAMRASFTDDGLQPGTKIKAVHLTELRDQINTFRAAASFQPVTISAAVGQKVKATDVTTLRTAINEARVALGALPITFSDNAIAVHSTVVRAAHVQELREAVR